MSEMYEISHLRRLKRELLGVVVPFVESIKFIVLCTSVDLSQGAELFAVPFCLMRFHVARYFPDIHKPL